MLPSAKEQLLMSDHTSLDILHTRHISFWIPITINRSDHIDLPSHLATRCSHLIQHFSNVITSITSSVCRSSLHPMQLPHASTGQALTAAICFHRSGTYSCHMLPKVRHLQLPTTHQQKPYPTSPLALDTYLCDPCCTDEHCTPPRQKEMKRIRHIYMLTFSS